MTDASRIVENLINTDGIHAFVFICEAADRYLPMIDSVGVLLANGKVVKVTEMGRTVSQKVDETRKTLQREDRIIWALRFYKKALIEQLVWMIQNEPSFFQQRFGAPPAAEQPALVKQLQKLSDVDISPFQEFDTEDIESLESPYSGFSTIDAINTRLGHYVDVNEKYGQTEPLNAINALRLSNETFGEVISLYRRAEVGMRSKSFPGGIQMFPTPEGPYDLQDKEGAVETIIEFPDGWRWFDLHRACSELRDDRTAASDIAITGHCANMANKSGMTAFELAEPLGNNRWKHHAFFVLHPNGRLGEMKGRKNQKPSPRLEKYIFELIRREKRIRWIGRSGGHAPTHDFSLGDLSRPHGDILKRERPELFGKEPSEDDEDKI